MRKSRLHRSLAVLVFTPLLVGGCSEDKPEPEPTAPVTTTSSPAPPVLGEDQIRKSLLSKEDLGSKWTSKPLSLDPIKEKKVALCSLSKRDFSQDPALFSEEFGAPDNKFTGATYARLVAAYEDTATAAAEFDEIKADAADCPKKKEIPFKRLPKKRFTYAHEDTWEMSEGDLSGWRHIRGFQKAVYSPSISDLNVFYFSFDYAQRGNVVFTSIYWQRVKADKSGDPIAEKATEVLTEQLKRFG